MRTAIDLFEMNSSERDPLWARMARLSCQPWQDHLAFWRLTMSGVPGNGGDGPKPDFSLAPFQGMR